MSTDDLADRKKKIQIKVLKIQCQPNTPPSLAGLTASDISRMSEPDLIEIERRTGGRVT